MKTVLDVFKDLELKEFLLTQDGIKSVDINNKDFVIELVIDYDEDITPFIIYKFIKLFNNSDVSCLIFFDKNYNYDIRVLKYAVGDMCCEYCYKGLIEELFMNDNVKSVNSNFDFNNFYNIELVVEYNKDYNKEELIEFIKNNV